MIWERVCADATNGDGRCDAEQAQRRFHEIAARIAQRGGRVGPEVGKVTRVGVEIDGGAFAALGDHELTIRTPGKDTLVAAETRRWTQTNGDPATGIERQQHPGTLISGYTAVPHSQPAAVMRSAERAEIDPEAVELVTRARRAGAPLDDALRSELEAALGARLDAVRVHTGADADAAARALGAVAFAIDDDVFFRDGAYDPLHREGQWLIAHEVAHIVQANGTTTTPDDGMTVSQPDDAPEREADMFADQFVSRLHDTGRPADPSAGTAECRVGERRLHPMIQPGAKPAMRNGQSAAARF